MPFLWGSFVPFFIRLLLSYARNPSAFFPFTRSPLHLPCRPFLRPTGRWCLLTPLGVCPYIAASVSKHTISLGREKAMDTLLAPIAGAAARRLLWMVSPAIIE